jgi:hypothetical protein
MHSEHCKKYNCKADAVVCLAGRAKGNHRRQMVIFTCRKHRKMFRAWLDRPALELVPSEWPLLRRFLAI